MLELFVYSIKLEGNDMAALSFLRPDEVDAAGLPAEAVLGEMDPRNRDMTVDGFTPNDAFLTFMHKLIGDHAPQLKSIQDQIDRGKKNGPVYVMDYRSINQGAKPPFDDVLGWFGVKDGELVPDSYNPNPNYKLMTNAGPLTLEAPLEELLLETVRGLIQPN